MPPTRRRNAFPILAGVLILILGAWRVGLDLTELADVEPFFNLPAAAALAGLGMAIIGLRRGWFDPETPLAPMPDGRFHAIALGVAALIGAFILRCGMHQIGGYDHSILVDFGWRLYQGQRPYADFPCTVPVAFPLGTKFAFQWFAVSWRSIVELTAFFSVVAFAWSLFLMVQLFGKSGSTLLWTFAVQAFSMMLASYWWYSPITAAGAVLYMLSAMYWLRRPRDRIALLSYAASLWLMATLKANVAGVLIPGFSIILFLSPLHRWKALAVSLVSFGFFLLFLAANHFSFFGLIEAYRGISPRGASLVPFLIDLDTGERRLSVAEMACLVLPVVAALGWSGRKSWSYVAALPALTVAAGVSCFLLDPSNPRMKPMVAAALVLPVILAIYPGRAALRQLPPWIGIIGVLGGLYGCLTNSEPKLVDLPPVFMGAALLVAGLRAPGEDERPIFQMPRAWNQYFSVVCTVLGCMALAAGYSRDRVRGIGPGKFFQFDDSKHIISHGFFKGVHCGDVFYNVLGEIGQLLSREPTASIWFGRRLEWAYAAFDKPSPRGEPVVWDRLTMFDRRREQFYFERFLRHRHPVLVFFHNELTDFIDAEGQQVMSQYTVDRSYPYLTVLRLKQPKPGDRNGTFVEKNGRDGWWSRGDSNP